MSTTQQRMVEGTITGEDNMNQTGQSRTLEMPPQEQIQENGQQKLLNETSPELTNPNSQKKAIQFKQPYANRKSSKETVYMTMADRKSHLKNPGNSPKVFTLQNSQISWQWSIGQESDCTLGAKKLQGTNYLGMIQRQYVPFYLFIVITLFLLLHN